MIQTIPKPENKRVSLQLPTCIRRSRAPKLQVAPLLPRTTVASINPAIDEGRDAGEEILSRINQCLIKFIEIEFLPQYCERERIEFSATIEERKRAGGAQQHCDKSKARNEWAESRS